MDYAYLDNALNQVKEHFSIDKISAGLVLGSGWGRVVDKLDVHAELSLSGLSNNDNNVPGHAGKLCLTNCAGVPTLVFQGRRHWYEGYGWTPVGLPLYLLAQLGAQAVCLTSSVGALHSVYNAGDLLVVTDHINGMGDNPLRGEHNCVWGERFPDMSKVYDERLSMQLFKIAARTELTAHQGTYCGLSGPNYETPAECKMLRAWGADVVGMSLVPEALLAHAAGLRVVALSCIANSSAENSDQQLTHIDVLSIVNATQQHLGKIITEFWSELAQEIQQ